jgi:hypothetical protein
MHSSRDNRRSHLRLTAALCAGTLLGGCTMQNQSAPDVVGPSGFGLSLMMTATPTVLPRDGSTQATITVVARDASGKPQPNVSFIMSVSPSIPLVQLDPATGADGSARLLLTAPSLDTVAPENNQVVLRITPLGDAIGGNFQNARAQSITLGLLGPRNATVPSPDFTMSPEDPKPGGTVVFDAAPTTDEGVPCVSCSYVWQIAGNVITGRIAAVAFSAPGSYEVILTATDATGTANSVGKAVEVAAAEEETEEPAAD